MKTSTRKRAAGTQRRAVVSGGNPQIAKADGEAPVQAYIAAMPAWKRGIGKRLDALIVRTVPHVRRAVKWNSPFYGVEGRGWFLSFHVFTRYVKVTFFSGTALDPVPPGGTAKEARWIDIHEDDLDEAQIAAWVKQAAALPGWGPGAPAAAARPSKTTKPKAGRTSRASSERRNRDEADWRQETLARMRALILQAAPAIVEERKWQKPSNPMGVPVWSHNGIVCTGETYKEVVKLTFARGASLPDPSRLFNASLEGNTRRAIDIRKGDQVNPRGFKALVRAAVAENARAAKTR